MILTEEVDEKVRRRPRRVTVLVALTATLSLLCCAGGTAAFFMDGLSSDGQVLTSRGSRDTAIRRSATQQRSSTLARS